MDDACGVDSRSPSDEPLADEANRTEPREGPHPHAGEWSEPRPLEELGELDAPPPDVALPFEPDPGKRLVASLKALSPECEPSEVQGLMEASKKASPDHYACLSSLDRASLRESIIRSLKGKLSSPARLVDAVLARPEGSEGEKKGQGKPIRFEPIEPWDDPVNGAELLTEISELARSILWITQGQADLLALWIAHTYATDQLDVTPRLLITSPEPTCGKTLALDFTARLVARPVSTSSMTPAVVFRVIEASHPCLLVDEADGLGKAEGQEELRAIFNSGYKRGGTAYRCVG